MPCSVKYWDDHISLRPYADVFTHLELTDFLGIPFYESLQLTHGVFVQVVLEVWDQVVVQIGTG